MAGLLYLPRLFVYHSRLTVGEEAAETFKVMELRLVRTIMNPAMISAYVFGILLLSTPGVVDWTAKSIYAKLVLVTVLTWLHQLFARWRRDLAEGRNRYSDRFYRAVNEAPAVVMIGIVILIVVRPL